VEFESREGEAAWIADSIRKLVGNDGKGAKHDAKDGWRGICLPDIAVLLRSTTNARTYVEALERKGIPAVFRTGPDLFSQPEVLLFMAVMSLAAGLDKFYGGGGASGSKKDLPSRIREALDCDPVPEKIVVAACKEMRRRGFPIGSGTAERLIKSASLVARKLEDGSRPTTEELKELKSGSLKAWLRIPGSPRRVFPQQLYHMFLQEAGTERWDPQQPRTASVLFHLGQLSTLIKGVESPGWVPKGDFKYRMTAAFQWGSKYGRNEEAPIFAAPEAVTISTIHSAKGLEFPVVFLADVNARRFPSLNARRLGEYPFEGKLAEEIDVSRLADNDNWDAERRLMYVALTRAERYLFISCSGKARSAFFREVKKIIGDSGGCIGKEAGAVPSNIKLLKSERSRETRLVTSFSDLRYYLECPYDFYLRIVLGFAPPIDQAFGYGRGVHNLLRAIHASPSEWAALAGDEHEVKRRIEGLVERGLFYLRYTVGEPLENMRRRAVEIVSSYVVDYEEELSRLEFEPEKEFETLIAEENALITGAIDIVRLDEPPRVTIIDFKSGEKDSDQRISLDPEEMRLQLQLYGLAAKRELQYETDKGLVRYLGEEDPGKKELEIDLDEASVRNAEKEVKKILRGIQNRDFLKGPSKAKGGKKRCESCDWVFCGMKRRT